jgi:hypothetical protein
MLFYAKNSMILNSNIIIYNTSIIDYDDILIFNNSMVCQEVKDGKK